jgi:hypothetical protein
MAVELRIYIGFPEAKRGSETTWFSVEAMIDLRAQRRDSAINEPPHSDDRVFFYGTDGNTKIYEDRYGSPLVAHDLRTVWELLEDSFPDEGYNTKRAMDLISSFRGDGYREYKAVLFFY